MITALEVMEWSGLSSVTTELETVTAATNEYVEALPHIDRLEDGTWANTTHLGAVMLAARLFRRRNSVGGIEAAGDAGVTYIARYDSDIARLLHLDSFVKPVIG